MSAPFDQAQFANARSQSHRETAAMWRGAAIGHFANLEAVALAWLIEVDAAGTFKTKPADFVAWHRFRRMATTLADPVFEPFNGKALGLLDLLESEHDFRTALAHGRMQSAATGVTLRWHALRDGAWFPRDKTFTWLEALTALNRVEKIRRDLASQLGQINRHRKQMLSRDA